MKKILTSVAIVAATFSFASSANAGNSAGCGLGSTIFAGKKGVIPNILAVTTNGTSGNQTFGITTGTLGCDQNDVIRSNSQLFSFADENLDKIAYDSSKGQGEYLESVATIIDVKEADKDHFYKTVQSNFSVIFSDQNTNTSEVLARLDEVMKSDQILKSYTI